jgi:peptide/nickel transport system permease protein
MTESLKNPSDPAPMPALAETASTGESVQKVILRAFLRPVMTRIAIGVIIALLVLAVIVPFIANGRPFAIWVNGDIHRPGKWIFPIFRALDRVDLILLVIAAGVLLWYFLRNALAGVRVPPRAIVSILAGAAMAGMLAWWMADAAMDIRGRVMAGAGIMLVVAAAQLLVSKTAWSRWPLAVSAVAMFGMVAVHCYISWEATPLGILILLLSFGLLFASWWFSREKILATADTVEIAAWRRRKNLLANISWMLGAAGLIWTFGWLTSHWHTNGGELFILLVAAALVALCIWAAVCAESLVWLPWACAMMMVMLTVGLLRIEAAPPLDWGLLICGMGVMYAGFYHLVANWSDQRFPWFFAIAGVVALSSLTIAALKLDYNDPNSYRDYESMVEAGTHAKPIYTLIKWDYKDFEPLDANRVYEGPSGDHWLGTDGNGRDVLARLLWSTRIVMSIGFVAVIISLVIGIIYGAFMGYFAGKVDLLGMRFIEIVDAVPTLFLIIIFVAIYGRQIFIIMIILGVTGWTGIAAFVRAEFLRIRKQDFVAAARAAGLPLGSILFRHILPNGLTPVIVNATFAVAGTVTIESTLSFIGLGIAPPTPSWGLILNEAGNPAQQFQPLMAAAAGGMIFITTFAYFIIGETFRDAIDPRLNKLQ